jgi:hypothetical protein
VKEALEVNLPATGFEVEIALTVALRGRRSGGNRSLGEGGVGREQGKSGEAGE